MADREAEPPRSKLGRAVEIARLVALPLAILGATAIFLRGVHPHYPIQRWLFWIYAKNWLWCALFVAASLSAGNLLLDVLGPRGLPLRERVVLAFPMGVLAFFFAFFVGGLAGILGPIFSSALPVALSAIGAPRLLRRGRCVARHLRAARRRGARARPWWFYPVLVFGLTGVGLVYFSILSPKNAAFDAHFYHLALAQQYATERAIRPAAEGWLPAALPHLASILYTWCFTLPAFDMFGRMTCAAHLEFTIFLFTLAGVPVLVRWLVPRARASVGWAAVFLFPGILLYDSSLSIAADHVAALFTVPVWLAFRRAWVALDARSCILTSACLAGALLTKYQAMYVAVFPVAALVLRCAWLLGQSALRKLRGGEAMEASWRPAAGLGLAAASGLALTTPHWLKNWVFYGDPLFPSLHRLFPPVRWVPDTGRLFEDWSAWQSKSWTPHGTPTEKLRKTLEALVTFSFDPHDWPRFHDDVPVFGSLFTLSVLVLVFLRGTKRVWALVAATHVGVFVWFWTMHQDRYLQVLLPWMAAVVAATIALVWRTHAVAKASALVLIGAQAVWGGDVFFIPGHAMTGTSPAKTSSDLLSMGYAKKYDARLEIGGSLFQIGRSPELPKDARVLIHENNPRLGIWRPVVGDIAGWQFGLRYELLQSPAAVHAALRRLGVTHIVARAGTSKLYDSVGADIRFYDFIEHGAVLMKSFGEFSLYRLPDEPPTEAPNDVVLYLGCNTKTYEPGLHPLRALDVREQQVQKQPPRRAAIERAPVNDEAALVALAAKADFVVTDAKCKPGAPSAALEKLTKIATRETEQLWARRRSKPAPAATP